MNKDHVAGQFVDVTEIDCLASKRLFRVAAVSQITLFGLSTSLSIYLMGCFL